MLVLAWSYDEERGDMVNIRFKLSIRLGTAAMPWVVLLWIILRIILS